jgi:acyl-CoA hydrolase
MCSSMVSPCRSLFHTIVVKYGGATVKVFALEYLMAIMIQLNKPKYRERLRVLLEEKLFDEQKLSGILHAHGLFQRWEGLRNQLKAGR